MQPSTKTTLAHAGFVVSQGGYFAAALLVSSTSPLYAMAEVGDAMAAVSAGGQVGLFSAALAGCLFAAVRRTAPSPGAAALGGGLVGALLAAVSFALFAPKAPFAARFAMGFVFGVGQLAFILLWCRLFARLESGSALIDIACALVVSGVFAVACANATWAVSRAVVVACTTLGAALPAAFLLKEGTRRKEGRSDAIAPIDEAGESGQADTPLDTKEPAATFKMVAFGPLLGMALYSMMSSSMTSLQHSYGILLFVAPLVALVVLAAVEAVWHAKRTAFVLNQGVLPVCAAVLLLFQVIPGGDAADTAFENCLFCLFSVAGVLSWTYMAESARAAGAAGTGDALVVCACQLLLAAAGLAGFVLAAADEDVRVALCAAATGVYLIYLVVDFSRTLARSPETPAAPQPRETYEDVCTRFADRCGLSPREREVLFLLGRGHSSTYIAKQLFISENTARNHMKNIYRKAGVSSKEELLERLDEHSDTPDAPSTTGTTGT